MRRYGFLDNSSVYDAINSLKDAFLAAKDGHEVVEIINGLLTEDEKIKIGRRIIIAGYIQSDLGYKETRLISNVGQATIAWISRQMIKYPKCFELIFQRKIKLEEKYKSKKYSYDMKYHIFRVNRNYTGIKRKDIKR